MAALQKKSLAEADAAIEAGGMGELRTMRVGAAAVHHYRCRPGWRWSERMRPKVGGDACTREHTGFCVAGALAVRMASGEEMVVRAGGAFHIAPNHDAWWSATRTWWASTSARRRRRRRSAAAHARALRGRRPRRGRAELDRKSFFVPRGPCERRAFSDQLIV